MQCSCAKAVWNQSLYQTREPFCAHSTLVPEFTERVHAKVTSNFDHPLVDQGFKTIWDFAREPGRNPPVKLKKPKSKADTILQHFIENLAFVMNIENVIIGEVLIVFQGVHKIVIEDVLTGSIKEVTKLKANIMEFEKERKESCQRRKAMLEATILKNKNKIDPVVQKLTGSAKTAWTNIEKLTGTKRKLCPQADLSKRVKDLHNLVADEDKKVIEEVFADFEVKYGP